MTNIGKLHNQPLTLEFNEKAFSASHTWIEETPGIHFLTIALTAIAAPALPELIIKWRIPISTSKASGIPVHATRNT